MGVHTGDAVTVAPAMTLTEREYRDVRELGIKIIREVGIAAGGCNIQFAINPADGRVVVIEMNPRVSRSSALASKATGYPIAKIAAKLAIGYTLDEITNDITGTTPAAFEPTMDYVAVKVPRTNVAKFPPAAPLRPTTRKSVREAMALGRNFTEALQEGLLPNDTPEIAFDYSGPAPDADRTAELLEQIATPTPERLIQVQQAVRGGARLDQIVAATGIDPWFVDQLLLLQEVADEIAATPRLDADVLRRAKRHGFSDQQIGDIRGLSEATVRELRHAFGLHPVYKTVDTCAGEFPAIMPYYYSSYDTQTEVAPRKRPAVLILGSGPNRIGQGIEFDYSCVHAALALQDRYETVMVNCNPEPVSTDHDTAARPDFDP